MKTFESIIMDLRSYTENFGFDPSTVRQGSDEWHLMKLGVISASHAENVLAKKKTAKRDGYMAELIGQIYTGERPEISAKALSWGNDNEAGARSAFQFETGLEIKEVPFIYKDSSLRVGCSPDGILSNGQGLELKCPLTSRVFIEFLTGEKIKPEYIKQCQFSMWVTGIDQWIFANYEPRAINGAKMLHHIVIDRDEAMMAEFDEKVGEFLWEMDQKLTGIGLEFGNQWVQLSEAA